MVFQLSEIMMKNCKAGQQLTLSGLSGKIGDLLEVKIKMKEEEARGVMLAMERGASPELIAKFREEQELFGDIKKLLNLL